jgi:Fe-S cluster biosynthesis and repair protein YggX
MQVNENRLNLSDAKARKFLADEMEKYLFGTGSAMPAGYVPPKQ